MAVLKIVSGDSAGASYAIGAGNQRVGRADGNDLCLRDGSISSSHCEMALDASGNLIVRDLNSTNGTFIGGQRVREALVRPGQQFRLGTLEVVFEGDGNYVVAGPVPVTLPPPPNPVRAVPPPPVQDVPVNAVPGPDDCVNHPCVKAVFVCMRCGKRVCAKCTKDQKLGMNIVNFCLGCGGQCKKASVVAKEAAKLAAMPKTFGEALKQAFKYPLQGNGLILLIAGTLFYAFIDTLLNMPMRGMIIFYFILCVFIIAYGYLFAYMQKIVTCSAQGEEEPPQWPEVADIQSDIVQPFLQLLLGLIFAFLPSWIVGNFLGPLPAQFMLLLGALYFPMAVLAVAMSDSYSGLNPIFVTSSIMKIPKPYLLTCVVFAALVFMWTHVRQGLYSIGIIIVPQLCYWFIFLFALMVGMRVLGMLYYMHKRELDWGL